MTQKERLDQVRSALKSVDPGTVVQGGPVFDLLREVFDGHPERAAKYGAGLAGFRVVVNPYGHRAVDVVRVDGSEVDASFHAAVRGTAVTPEQNLRAAMRTAVIPDVDRVRDGLPPGALCEICREPLGGAGPSHVDHDCPTFERLAREFLTGRADAPAAFADAPDNSAQFRPADAAFEAEWVAYHARNARLRVVHAKCNLERRRVPRWP